MKLTMTATSAPKPPGAASRWKALIVVVALAVWLLAEGLLAGTANAAPPLMAKDFSKPAIAGNGIYCVLIRSG